MHTGINGIFKTARISGDLVFLAIVGVITCLIVLYRRQIAEWLIGNLRGGGPRPPSHPLPGNDAFLLLRRRKRNAELPDANRL